MKKTYADVCLERAEKAIEGPWEFVLRKGFPTITSVGFTKSSEPFFDINGDFEAEFCAHARTDVPELARRLDRAYKFINILKDYFEKMARIDPALSHYLKAFEMILDELERMPEDGK